MRTGAISKIRTLLRSKPDGLSVREVAEIVGCEEANTGRYLRQMPDAYIDRWDWLYNHNGHKYWYAVWCVVQVPDDCPHPTRKVVAVRQGRPRDLARDAPSSRAREHND